MRQACGSEPAAGETPAAAAPPAGPCGDAWERWIALARAGEGPERLAAAQALAADARAAAAKAADAPAGTPAAWEAWGSCTDPVAPSEALAPWRPDLAKRTLEALAAAAEAVAGGKAPAEAEALLRMPSEALAKREALPLESGLLGAVPVGDVLAAMGGVPFALPERRLARMGLQDPAHRAYLDVQSTYLSSVAPADLPAEVETIAQKYDRMGHTSRWYNRAAARQGAARHLAARGAWRSAARVLSAERDMEGPGWQAVNRAGALRLLEAQALLWLRDPSASRVLEAAGEALSGFEGAVAGK
jgi:hypothetical protein